MKTSRRGIAFAGALVVVLAAAVLGIVVTMPFAAGDNDGAPPTTQPGSVSSWTSWPGSTPRLDSLEFFTTRGLAPRSVLFPSPTHFSKSWFQFAPSAAAGRTELVRISDRGHVEGVYLAPKALSTACDPVLLRATILVATCASNRAELYAMTTLGAIRWHITLAGGREMFDDVLVLRGGQISLVRWSVHPGGRQIQIVHAEVAQTGTIVSTRLAMIELPAPIQSFPGSSPTFTGALLQVNDRALAFAGASAANGCLVTLTATTSGRLVWARENLRLCSLSLFLDGIVDTRSTIVVLVNNEIMTAATALTLNGRTIWTQVINDAAPSATGTPDAIEATTSGDVAIAGAGNGALFYPSGAAQNRPYGMFYVVLSRSDGQVESLARTKSMVDFGGFSPIVAPAAIFEATSTLSIFAHVLATPWNANLRKVPYAVLTFGN